MDCCGTSECSESEVCVGEIGSICEAVMCSRGTGCTRDVQVPDGYTVECLPGNVYDYCRYVKQ
jgi:hypothetical protein